MCCPGMQKALARAEAESQQLEEEAEAMRRLKVEVEKSMPPKKETKLFLPLVPMQTEWYRKVLMRELEALSDGRGRTAM